MHPFIQKLKVNRTLYTQLLFTMIAFIAMVVLSYNFMSSIVRKGLVRNAKSVLDFAEVQVTSHLLEPKVMLEGFSETIRSMVLQGESAELLQKFIDDTSNYIILSGKNTAGIRGFYGYFETLPNGPVLLHSSHWKPDIDYQPEEHSWYQLSVASKGGIVETAPYISNKNETLFTYAVSIFDAENTRLGVICLDVRIDDIGQDIVNTALDQGGYGMLLNQDLLILAHPNSEFVNKNIQDPIIPVSIFTEDLMNEKEVFEQSVTSFYNEPSVAFFRKLPNDWYLGFVTPKEQYYQSITAMAAILTLLGAALAAVLMIILIFIDRAKTQSDFENKQKSVFLANMSHEIRTPINAIIGMTTIGKSAADTNRKDYCFRKIEGASQHLLGVINDILDMSKIEADKFELIPSEFCFGDMLSRVEGIMSFRIAEKQQTLSITADEHIPAILICDDQRLIQVIINLLSNAVKFTPEGGNISLHSYLLEETDYECSIAIEITDTGIGISPEQQMKLFKPFEQADSTTSRKFGGTGLGLVISKRIVEMMGGEIRVKSEPAKGSTFTFTFLAVRGNEHDKRVEALEQNAQGQMLPGEFTGCRILLAEDVEINREIVLAFMEESGAVIDCAENGIEAITLLDKHPGEYSLIFMDVQMPEMDGLEATRKIRERGETIPIIAMTANVFREDIEKCLEAGMDSHLGKPLDFSEVLDAVRRYWGG